MNMLKKFWAEEEGMAVVEILLIIAVLIIIALLFKDAIISWVNSMMSTIFDPKVIPTPSITQT